MDNASLGLSDVSGPSPGANSGTNAPSNHKPKAGAGKRSFRRALAEAAKHGYATYRGQKLHVHKEFVPTLRSPPRASIQGERIQCLSWNCSGFSMELQAEFFTWLETQPDVGLFALQETHWNFTGDWISSGWFLIHSTTGKTKSGGILLGVRTAHVNADAIRWQEVIPGRLVHMRFKWKRQQFDAVSVYQHAMSYNDGEQKTALMKRRSGLWNKLDTLLGSLPVRSSVVLMGDFNIAVAARKGVAGSGVHTGSATAEISADRDLLMALLDRHKLCALNTWGKKEYTYQHPKGASQIDYICCRQAVADGGAKKCRAADVPIAGWRSSGHLVLSANIPLNWRPWKQVPNSRSSRATQSFPPLEVVLAEANPSLDRLQGAIKQHCEISEAKPTKPPLKDLGVEVAHLWEQGKGLDREGRAAITLKDCFGALKQHAAVSKAHRALRKAARQRKRAQLLTVLSEAEAAAQAHDTKKLFQFVRLLAPKLSSKKIRLRGSKGELMEPTQECTLLAEYARELFRGDGMIGVEPAPLPSEWFHEDEWRLALGSLQPRRAVPRTSASVRAWQAVADRVAPHLQSLAQSSLTGSAVQIPHSWSTVQLAWLAKQGKAPVSPCNLRSVGLMSPDTKAFLLILKKHANPYVQAALQGVPQYAYRRGTSTSEPIMRASQHCSEVRRILELHKGDLTTRLLAQQEAELVGGVMCSIDLAKAFDSVDYREMLLSLTDTGMPENLARVLIAVHVQTELHIHHGGELQVVQMSRGLRQGCPIAPMIYAAWTCRLCKLINARLGQTWTQEHMSLFADDKHCYWQVRSKREFQGALHQLDVILSLLRETKMQVNFSKSAVVYALRGRAAEEMVAKYTRWHNGSRCLLIRGQSGAVKIPIVDRFVYLGVTLSYGAFEMQSVQHRVSKANQSFGNLKKILRVNGDLSVQNRLKVYKACVIPSLLYGIPAVGVTAGSLQTLSSTLAQHLRKVIRVKAWGVTNHDVLRQAGVDLYAHLIHSTQLQCSKLEMQPEGITEKLRAREISQQVMVYAEQDSTQHIHALVSDQVPKVACPVCGLYFAGEHGVQMHIKAKHSQLNQDAKHVFVRSKHSLFGLPYCRFCRGRSWDWQALEKHVTEGACPRIKACIAQGSTVEQLYAEVLAEEQINPPEPPDQSIKHVEPFVDTKHPLLGAQLKDVPKHVDVMPDLCVRCVLCGQRVQEASRIKTHWRATHPIAWKAVSRGAELDAKTMSKIFVSPCAFCGAKTKDPEAHAPRCAPFFQANAARHLARNHSVRLEMEGSKAESLRQHEREPQYTTWTVTSTPIGQAMGLKQRGKAQAEHITPTTVTSASLLGTSGVTVSAGVNYNSVDSGETGIRKYFFNPGTPTNRSQVSSPVSQVDQNGGWLLQVRLYNPHSLCYMNSSVVAIMRALEYGNHMYGRLQFLKNNLQSSAQSGEVARLSSMLMLRSLLPRWRYNSEQRDAAEYTMQFLEAAGALQCLWVARTPGAGDEAEEHGGVPVLMSLMRRNGNLQQVVDAWSLGEAGLERAILQFDKALVLQLGRFGDGEKIFDVVDFQGPVEIPFLEVQGNVVRRSFVVVAVVFHTGRTCDAGHYQTVIQVGGQWWVCDDGRAAVRGEITEHIQRNVYVLWLAPSEN